jgi:uncharacterized iron-regulated membrane protein
MSIRKILFWIHLTAGCLAGLVIFAMSVTGVLLAYERQLIRFFDRGAQSFPPSPGAAPLPISAILGGLEGPTAVTIHFDPAAPAEVSFGRDRVLLVDRYNGKTLGESAPRARAFFQSMEDIHRWLGASGEHRAGGRAITGACNLTFLLLVISGPFLWLPRRWSRQNVRSVLVFRGKLSGRARDFNWHNVFGIWSTIPLLVIVASGVVMSYPWANDLLYRWTGSPAAAERPGGRGGPGGDAGRRNPGPGLAIADSAWLRAEQRIPGWRSITLRVPPTGGGPLAFTIDTGDGGRPDQKTQLTLNPRTGETIRVEAFSNYNTGRRVRGWLRFLHTGEAGGVAGESIAGLASAGGALLVWTGISLALRRLLGSIRRRNSAVVSPTQEIAV